MERRAALGLIAATGGAAAFPALPAFAAGPDRAAGGTAQGTGGYTFALDNNVKRTSVRFNNRYGITVAGDLDVPKNAPDTIELVIVPGADHVDLYDRTDLIPFNRLDEFFTQNLSQ